MVYVHDHERAEWLHAACEHAWSHGCSSNPARWDMLVKGCQDCHLAHYQHGEPQLSACKWEHLH